ncbi:hypothetical protein B0H10DRAFT_1944427 [Mycena sp. CBHHK59/15]|nr:hypothetical protein B0H10DRAFT_1944427 [Mycena sp. CBHHK59/15]
MVGAQEVGPKRANQSVMCQGGHAQSSCCKVRDGLDKFALVGLDQAFCRICDKIASVVCHGGSINDAILGAALSARRVGEGNWSVANSERKRRTSCGDVTYSTASATREISLSLEERWGTDMHATRHRHFRTTSFFGSDTARLSSVATLPFMWMQCYERHCTELADERCTRKRTTHETEESARVHTYLSWRRD